MQQVITYLNLLGKMLVLKLNLLNSCQTNALTVSQEVIKTLLWIKPKMDKSHEFALVMVK